MRLIFRLAACLAAAALLAGTRADAADDALDDLGRKLCEVLTETKDAGKLVFHWSAEQIDPGQADAAQKRTAEFYADVEKRLGVKVPLPVHVFLYPSSEKMRELTGRKANSVAWSKDRMVHVPHDYGDCHELVHVFADHIPRDADSVPPEGFFIEGLACALQARDQGIPMSDWCAVYLRHGRLPSLVELRRSFPEGAPKGVHPYHPAGSFHDFLIERYGIEKVKTVHTHCLEFQGILGKSFVALEREWRTWLAARKVDPAHDAHVRRALGVLGPDRDLPAALRDAKGARLLDGKSLDGWTPESEGVWSVRDGLLVGRTSEKWIHAHTVDAKPGTRGVRARFRMPEGDAFKLRLNYADGKAAEAIFARWSSFVFVYDEAGRAGGIGKSEWKFSHGQWVDAVFLNDDGVGRLYVNGVLEIETPARLPTADGLIGVAVEKGVVEIATLEALPR